MLTFPLALIFDLNGTMINDMEFHLKAWTEILNNDLKAALSPEQVKSQMYGKNSELFVRVFGKGKFTEAEMEYWSNEKEKRYQKAYLPYLQLIKGLREFLDKAMEKKIPMAIGSAAIPFNIDFVLDNLNIRKYFSAIVSADDVAISKPDPETFLKAADLLKTEPSACLVFEDAPKGAEAAALAGMKCVVLTTMHNRNDFFRTDHILAFIKDYSDPFILSLF
ncbi:MAG TPA: HAD family phosphatase [Puia sp.]|jgi:beta-phosphoglucomutase|nr:HAD family phosphatase [Puia sp.]